VKADLKGGVLTVSVGKKAADEIARVRKVTIGKG
jgi:HSP20 family molecular chaperone IbpA